MQLLATPTYRNSAKAEVTAGHQRGVIGLADSNNQLWKVFPYCDRNSVTLKRPTDQVFDQTGNTGCGKLSRGPRSELKPENESSCRLGY